MVDLHDAQLKLARAEYHLEALNSEIRKFGLEKLHAYRIESNEVTGIHTLHGKRMRPIPTEWSLLVGEFAHNARSTLDMLVFQLSELSRDDGGRERLQFPICDNKRDFERRSIRDLKGIAPDLQEMIESRQPYNAECDAAEDPLWLLAKMNNLDKHRFIPVVTFVSNVESARFSAPPGDVGRFGSNITLGGGAAIRIGKGAGIRAPGISLKWLRGNAIGEEETPIAELEWGARTRLRVEVRVSAEIRFGTAGYRLDGRSVPSTLRSMLDRVRDVLAAFG